MAMKLKQKLTLGFIALLITFMGVLYFIVVRDSSQIIRDDAVRELHLIGNHIESRLEDLERFKKKSFRLVVTRTWLRKLLINFLRDPSPQAREGIIEILKDAEQVEEEFYGFSLYDTEGRLQISTLREGQAKPQLEPAELLRAKQEIFTSVREHSQKNQYLKTLGPIYYEGELIAILSALSSVEHMREAVSSYATLNKTGKAYLAVKDSEGTPFLVASTELSAEHRLVETMIKEFSDNHVKDFDEQLKDGVARTLSDEKGENFFCLTRSLDQKNRLLIVTVSQGEMMAATKKMYGDMLLAFLPITGLGILMAWLMGALVVRPVTRLSKLCADVIVSDVPNIQVPANLRKGSDEIAVLAQAVQVMMSRLENYTRDMQEKERALLNMMEDAHLARLEAEKARDATVRLATIVDSSKDAIIGKTLEGIVTTWNPGAEEMYGYKADEIVGQSIKILVPDSLESEIDNLNKTLGQGKNIKNFETLRKCKSGKVLNVSLSLSPIYDQNKKIIGASTIARDITERKKYEDLIKTKSKQLETLIYIVSHDLGEPLRAMRSFSKLIRERYEDALDAKGIDFLARIERAGKRMQNLLDDILNLSRVQRMEETFEEVEGKTLVDEALKPLWETIDKKEAKLTIAKNFPVFVVNKLWATQGLTNLIANALKFHLPGKAPEIEIDFYREEEPAGILGFTVKDRGPGVDPEQAERIFTLFQRAVSREIEGTGAGLAIVAEVAKNHHGKAWVRPREGGGSEFILTFKTNLNLKSSL